MNTWHMELEHQYAPYLKKALDLNALSFSEDLTQEHAVYDIQISGPMDAYKVGMEMCMALIDKAKGKQASN